MSFDGNFEDPATIKATARPVDVLKLWVEGGANAGTKTGIEPGSTTRPLTGLDCSAPIYATDSSSCAEKASDSSRRTLAAKQHDEHEKTFKLHGAALRKALKLPAGATLDQTTEALATLRKEDPRAYQKINGDYLQRNMPRQTSAYIREQMETIEHQKDLKFHGDGLKKALDLPSSARLEDVIKELAKLRSDDPKTYAKIDNEYLSRNMPRGTADFIRRKVEK